MSINCAITFDRQNAVYNNGDTLNGMATVHVNQAKSIRAIVIKIVGYAKVYWTQTVSGKSKRFTGQEDFLNSVNYVLGSRDGESFDIAPGVYQYTFNCDLPIQLPMTMVEKCGKIKYKVLVTIDRRLRIDDVFKQEFYVNRQLNLNMMSTINRNPRSLSNDIETLIPFRLCCYNTNEIKIELHIPTDGFAPGQQIPFSFFVFNNSNRDIPETKVKLMKCFLYEANHPYEKEKDEDKQIMEKTFGSVPRHTNKEFKDSFNVPNIQATFHTKIIKLTYKIRAKVHGYWLKNMSVNIPVTIGTIPISNPESGSGSNYDNNEKSKLL